MTELNGITVITENVEDRLNERQLLDYRKHRRDCLRWLLERGKFPGDYKGYAETTVSARGYRMDQFYRWVWDQEDRYTSDVTHEHADEWMFELAKSEKSNVHKSNCQKALKMLFKWRQHEHGLDEWEPEITFSSSSGATQPRDFLTREERRKVRDAALEHGTVPSYGSLSPEERERWRAYIAQRFGKPKSEVSPDDWDRANGWKVPSIVWTSLDTGLRPIEVDRARIHWVDLKNNLLRIPKEESSKNTNNWKVGLKERTAEMLRRWIEERDNYPKYDDTDALWLTNRGNPYSSATLKRLLERICETAGIRTENRKVSWYSIRHSVGTYMAREEGLAAAQAQLRHKSVETTMKYDQVPVEDRRDALDRMG